MAGNIDVNYGLSQAVMEALRPKALAVNEAQYLTPDSLLVYCQTRLRDLDRGIRERMTTENGNIKLRGEVDRVLSSMAKDFPREGPQSPEGWDKAAAQVRSLIDKFPEGDSRRGELEKIAKELDAGSGPAEGGNTTRWAGWQSAVKAIGDDISHGSEMAMLEIQSLMSQRQTAIQLVTGMLSKMSETTQAIAQKI